MQDFIHQALFTKKMPEKLYTNVKTMCAFSIDNWNIPCTAPFYISASFTADLGELVLGLIVEALSEREGSPSHMSSTCVQINLHI